MRKILISGTLIIGIILGSPVLSTAVTVDPNLEVDIYDANKVYPGTTLLPDHYDPAKTRVIEVNMKGEVIWEYLLPPQYSRYTNPGFDAERLANDNILIVLPGKGMIEVNRAGKVVWSHMDKKISHDADRLANGNTLYVFGNNDKLDDAQVKEINSQGQIVWSWSAKNYFSDSDEAGTFDAGWTHMNAVERMANGHTLVSPRNFNYLLELDAGGKIVKTIGKGFLKHQHDPEVLANGNILVANHGQPQEAIEIDAKTGEIVWRFSVPKRKAYPLRDADRLPNGNTLVTGTTVIVEVTPAGEIVWRLKLKNANFKSRRDAPSKGFYKAQRIAR